MTKEKAIQLAIEYQKEHHQSVKIAKVHRLDQDKMDAYIESLGKPIPADLPDWIRLVPHWVVLFEREVDMVPRHYLISVYDDGAVEETPAL